MKRATCLDDLLDRKAEPFASFHDATLSNIHIDYKLKTLSAEFKVCVGSPDDPEEINRERTRNGVLSLTGLVLWAIEPPEIQRKKEWGQPWLTHDSLMEEATAEYGKNLAAIIGQDVYAWFMYFRDMNAFGYCICHEASFEWKGTHNQAL